MFSILKSAFVILLASSVAANAWIEIPKISKDSPKLNKNTINPCTSKETIKNLKSLTHFLAMKKWFALAAESEDAREYAKATNQYLQKSSMIPFFIRHYLDESSENIAFCSAVLTINGKPLIVTGEEGRNHVRFLIMHNKGKFKNILVIDYDTAIFDFIYGTKPETLAKS
jgi:hypothetical protein